MADASRDGNFVTTLLGASSADGTTPVKVYANPSTHRLLVDNAGGGSGTVTDVSVVTANGFAGTVANSTTTPAITLSTTITGVLKGDGTAISAASSSTDYAALAFKTIAVSGQSDVVADSPIDTLTLVGSGITITTNASTDTITFTGGASGLTVGTTTITSGTNTKVLFDNSGVLGEYTISGSGNVAMTTSPTFTTPTLGAATATSINNLTITSSTGTLTIAAAKVATISNTLTFTGTDGSSVAFGTGGTVLYTGSTIPLTVGSTTIASGTNTRILYDNSGVLGEYTLTGSGTVVVMQNTPTLTTPVLGIATATSINKVAITAPATSSTLTIADGKTLTASDTTTFATNTITMGGGEVITFSASNALSLLSGGTSVMTFPTTTDTVVTLAASQTLTNKTLTSPTIQTLPVYATGTNLIMTVPTVDDTATGEITNLFNSGYSSSAIGDLVYLDSSATWQKADADASATTYGSGPLGIALEVKASGNALKVLLRGFAYCSTAFPTFTIGGAIYMSATAAAVTQTAPATTDSATRVLGYAVHADKMWFNPSNDYITHT